MEETFVEFYRKCLEKEISLPLAAMKTLIKVIELSKAETIQGIDDELKNVIKDLKNSSVNPTSITSGCALFIRFITLAAPEELLSKEFSECKRALVSRGQLFLQRAENSRKQIAVLSEQFIRDGSVILTHGKSKVILNLLIEASERKKKFSVYVTESMPDKQGLETQKILKENNIPCTVILDSCVGYIMERIDMVLLGAEAIVESGGIINKIGTYQLAVVAKALNKPVYVAAESFKFLREYPLKQKEVSNKCKYYNEEEGHPSVDYTPPSYIALLFTDLGVLTPSAVSDELIKLYL